MGLTAHTKHALRLSLGHQSGTEMINAIEGFADTLAALTTPAPASPVVEPSVTVPAQAPAAPAPVVPPAEDEASHLDAPV